MTITTLSSVNTPSRWGELGCAPRTDDAKSKPAAKAERAEKAERDEGPRRSPLYGAIKAALEEVVAQAEGGEGEAAAEDNKALEQAIAAFARALMHALHEDRGHHYGWANASQRVEKLARDVAPEATKPVEPAPVDTPAEATPEPAPPTTTTTTPAEPAASAEAPTVSVRLTLELKLADSPWKSAHDGLIESFAEVQRSVGRSINAKRDDDEQSLEERLQQMLQALAAKLRANAVTSAALAPPGALLSVVA